MEVVRTSTEASMEVVRTSKEASVEEVEASMEVLRKPTEASIEFVEAYMETGAVNVAFVEVVDADTELGTPSAKTANPSTDVSVDFHGKQEKFARPRGSTVYAGNSHLPRKLPLVLWKLVGFHERIQYFHGT